MRAVSATSRPGSWLLVALLGLLSAASAAAQPPIYEIRHDGQTLGYLLGTMHSGDPRVLATMAAIEPLLDEVESLAVEMVPDGVALVAVGVASLLPAGQDLETQIGAQRFAALSRIARQRGLEPAVLNRLKPWAAAVTLAVPTSSSATVLDTEVYLAAQRRGQRVVGLETAAEQVAVFEGMGADLQLLLLDAMIKNAAQWPLQLEELTKAYLSGDSQRIMRVARSQYDGVPSAIRDWFDTELLDRRNARMLQRLDGLLGRERLLIAVGAMHLGGASGLLEGLERRGYALRPVHAPRH
jgi:hypothetical protein